MNQNPCKLPRDVRFLILQDFKPSDLLNLCQVNTDCAKICEDENFWKRKLAKDYPNIEYKYKSNLELYKRLTLGLGKLYTLKLNGNNFSIKPVDIDYLVSNLILFEQPNIIYVRDAKNQIQTLSESLLDIYIKKYGRSDILAVHSSHELYILTTNRELYRFESDKNLVLIANHVKEFSGCVESRVDSIVYYIDTDDNLYVKKELDSDNEDEEYTIDTKEFEYQDRVESVFPDEYRLYYINMDSDLYQYRYNEHEYLFNVKEKTRQVSSVKQFAVKNDSYYILDTNNTCIFFKEENYNITGGYYPEIKTLFANASSDYIFVQTFDLKLFLVTWDELIFVAKNVLKVIYSNNNIYLILLPIKD